MKRLYRLHEIGPRLFKPGDGFTVRPQADRGPAETPVVTQDPKFAGLMTIAEPPLVFDGSATAGKVVAREVRQWQIPETVYDFTEWMNSGVPIGICGTGSWQFRVAWQDRDGPVVWSGWSETILRPVCMLHAHIGMADHVSNANVGAIWHGASLANFPGSSTTADDLNVDSGIGGTHLGGLIWVDGPMFIRLYTVRLAAQLPADPDPEADYLKIDGVRSVRFVTAGNQLSPVLTETGTTVSFYDGETGAGAWVEAFLRDAVAAGVPEELWFYPEDFDAGVWASATNLPTGASA